MLTKLFCKAQTLVTEFKNDERGVTAIEYGLIAVAMAAVLGVLFGSDGGTVGTALSTVFNGIITDLSGASS
ncbi:MULTISPECIES: Flp family type IVb pilin [unclassified Vibrio]|uniref:Flp family type IVb pilin n=1 Tax=Vibrio sp. HB236076 TaxID=3232307 RepID=A0AB39HIA8_9VIBR|nr:Flp family type IVb pilin [Vibrio sp. HB161653]MDP5253179.1 Flp family type IVb pilin [Vibrio sp. HB161653]